MPIGCWKGRDRRIAVSGYVEVKVPEHPRAHGNGWVYEHVLRVEHALNRLLVRSETIHHINGNKQDNRIENLFPCWRVEHDRAHGMMTVHSRKLRPEWVCGTCVVCGTIYWGPKRIVSKKNRCSGSCTPKDNLHG